MPFNLDLSERPADGRGWHHPDYTRHAAEHARLRRMAGLNVKNEAAPPLRPLHETLGDAARRAVAPAPEP